VASAIGTSTTATVRVATAEIVHVIRVGRVRSCIIGIRVMLLALLLALLLLLLLLQAEVHLLHALQDL
jgi:hypothetical protein